MTTRLILAPTRGIFQQQEGSMKILRQADAWGVGRANAKKSQTEAHARTQSEDAKQARREWNRKLAESVVKSWSAAQYRELFNDELACALDGKHDGAFDPAKYKPTMIERSVGASDAAVATVTARHERKRKEASFVSTQMDRRNK